ncbi:DNA polymerase III subunit beta family protein [Streptomyces xanthophaeus]
MDDTDALMSIGAFARRVGLAPSALRFYDDCDVLRPAHVDDVTGYRYYSPGQEARAVLVRRLREAGMPLTEASVVLDGTAEEARALLEGHARRARETAASAQSAVEDVLRGLAGARRTAVRLGGPELASAVRQVAPAAAGGPARGEYPVLGCVLIELDRQEVRLVATDRYRLAVRALRPASFEGHPCHVLVEAAELKEAVSWAVRQPDLSIEVDGRGVRLLGEGSERELLSVDGTFPDYRAVLDSPSAALHRVLTDRAALRAAAADPDHDGPLVLHSEEHHLGVTSRGRATARLAAVCTGGPVRIAFDPAVLLAALDAGVGPDVLLDISSPAQPVVVRSADQGSFTTLVMPVQEAPAADA